MRREEEEEAIARVAVGDISGLVAAVVGDFDWSINSVKAKQGGEYFTLYTPSGGKTPAELVPGQNWELMVYWSCVNNNKGLTGWAAGVTMVASSSVPSQYREQFKRADYEFASSFSNQNYDFNMGAMPTGNVTIYRIKTWATQDWLPSATPPSSEW